jgi:hypothetical protein
MSATSSTDGFVNDAFPLRPSADAAADARRTDPASSRSTVMIGTLSPAARRASSAPSGGSRRIFAPVSSR